jgi:hypothetical protein
MSIPPPNTGWLCIGLAVLLVLLHSAFVRLSPQLPHNVKKKEDDKERRDAERDRARERQQETMRERAAEKAEERERERAEREEKARVQKEEKEKARRLRKEAEKVETERAEEERAASVKRMEADAKAREEKELREAAEARAAAQARAAVGAEFVQPAAVSPQPRRHEASPNSRASPTSKSLSLTLKFNSGPDLKLSLPSTVTVSELKARVESDGTEAPRFVYRGQFLTGGRIADIPNWNDGNAIHCSTKKRGALTVEKEGEGEGEGEKEGEGEDDGEGRDESDEELYGEGGAADGQTVESESDLPCRPASENQPLDLVVTVKFSASSFKPISFVLPRDATIEGLQKKVDAELEDEKVKYFNIRGKVVKKSTIIAKIDGWTDGQVIHCVTTNCPDLFGN